MSKYKEVVYMVMDELKLASDDTYFNEDHIIFLLNKYRAFILKQRYSDVKKQIPESNYSNITVDLMESYGIEGVSCSDTYLKSTIKIPNLLKISTPSIYTYNYFNGNISFISKDRMKYVGCNKYLQNIIYASLGPDNYLYLKSSNPQFLHLEKVTIRGIVEDPSTLQNNQENGECDILEMEFPLENALIPPVIELVVKELSPAIYRPEDTINNAKDDNSDLAGFLKRNLKSDLNKQIFE